MRSNDGMEVLFDPLIFPLGKSISLGVECSRQVLFDPELLSDGFPEMRSETGVLIADDFSRETEPSVYIVKV